MRLLGGWRLLTPLLALAVVAGALLTTGTARADGDPAAQALDALQQSVPTLVQDSGTVAASSDSDSAVVTSDGASTVDVPADPSQPLSLTTTTGADISIGIPGGDQGADAVPVANGVVAYDGAATATLFVAQVVPAGTDMTPSADDSSAPASDPSAGVGFRLLTVIQDASAPADFSFPITLPEGASIFLQDDGSYLIVDANGTALATIGAPWARDANNAPVPTVFTLMGTTLFMHVDTTGAAFPITADPDLTSCIKGGPGGTAARRNAVMAGALRYNHTAYVYGGGNACGPTGGGFDCSGLMMYAFAQVGIVLPHYSGRGGDYSRGTVVTPNTASLQPGDLVFYSGSSDPQHVGMYIGNGNVAQALGARWGVGVWPLSYPGAPVGARRLIP